MIFAKWPPRPIMAVLVAAACCLAASAARAEPEFASPWSSDMKSKARLIAAGAGQGGRYLAGIQIVLSGRTVTYWRTPGDAGTPPVVSFEGSTNLANARMEFPAPRRIDEDGIEALGYLEDVIFPLRVTASDPTKPIALHMKLDYAACEKICIPVHAKADLVLPQGKEVGPFAAELAAAQARVPVRQGPGTTGALKITGVRGLSGDWAAGKGRFVVDARVPSGAVPVTLFAEGPSGWYLQPAATAPRGSGGSIAIDVNIVQAPAGADIAKTPFVLTLVAGDHAVEVPVRLDSRHGAF